MAEVEKVSAAVVAATATVASATEIPACGVAGDGGVELGTSPTINSNNSHPHDSDRYDTASDLEDGEEYDDDDDDDEDDDDGESITDSDDDDDDDDEEEEDENVIGKGAGNQDKIDAEAQRKVDEDRSNPQYIPKRGTFYEHDDRTAEGGAEAMPSANVAEGADAVDDSESVAGGGTKSPHSPIISHASKTMKKWQQASGADRWSHDRFDESEQAPKSRSEIVNSYGYDIRTEDAPPRARRRRRYGRGPSKYSRNWEDETAYLKASNKERKPPRPSDFPELNERRMKTRKPVRGTREEKENHMEERRQMSSVGSSNIGEKMPVAPQRSAHQDDQRWERVDSKVGKNKGYGRTNGPVGRQAAMEFKQKQRSGPPHQSSVSPNRNIPNNRNDTQYDRQLNRPQNSHHASMKEQQQHHKSSSKGQSHSKHSQQQQQHHHQNDSFNNSKTPDQAYQQMQSPQQQSLPMRQPVPPKTTPTSNLSQRLLQVQNRNDPSHVGSVQMHALATQNQLVGQQASAMLLSPQQQQQQQHPQQAPQLPQEPRGAPKRYSSIRRSQHEAQHLAEQHQLQQLHMYATVPTAPQPQPQYGGAAAPAAPPTAYYVAAPDYTTVPGAPQSQAQPQYGAAPGPAVPPTAYYVATPDAYAAATAAANAQPSAPQAAQYAQPPPNYLPQTQAAAAGAALAYANAPPPPTQQAVPPVVGSAPYGPATALVQPPPSAGPVPAAQSPANSNPNYPNYHQNYNTVGGTTYFVPPVQTTTRPVVLPQRRPTNAIPILPPAEKNQQRSADVKDELKNNGAGGSTAQSTAPIGSAENIDHIIDNMFVQRPAFQPPQANVVAATTAAVQPRKSASPPLITETTNAAVVAGEAIATAGQSDETGSNNAASNTTSTTTTTTTTEKASNVAEVGPLENTNSGNAVAVQE